VVGSWAATMIRRLRMASGLVLFTYVVAHLVNHSLGIASVAAMEGMLRWVYPVWTSIPGRVALYGAFLTHLALAFYALWEGVDGALVRRAH
jgi:adenylate cyclase